MNTILEHASLVGYERERVKLATQAYLGELRDGLLSGAAHRLPNLAECAGQVLARLAAANTPHLRRLINATGVVLHTNLGRAPIGAEIGAAMAYICSGYSNIEYDLDTGRREDRFRHVEGLVRELTGAEAAMVVNNNAAAVHIMLCALANGRKVAISRGELVEIGGSFRMPDIMEQSGAELVEVGTTNRTKLSDYVDAVERKGAEVLLKVHASNYEIVGFTESVSAAELAAYGNEAGLPALYDAGACFLIEPEAIGIRAGASARSAINSGMDVICFSGDKLMGSAQAGILAGRGAYIDRIKKHPLTRAFRPDKLTLAALEATLRLYRYPDEAMRRIPAIAMLAAKPEDLRRRACALAARMRMSFPGWEIMAHETTDEIGGGSLPNVHLPGWGVAVKPAAISVGELEKRMRGGDLPVILRIRDGMAWICLRTLLPGEDEELLAAFTSRGFL